jgi:hypothetical protein
VDLGFLEISRIYTFSGNYSDFTPISWPKSHKISTFWINKWLFKTSNFSFNILLVSKNSQPCVSLGFSGFGLFTYSVFYAENKRKFDIKIDVFSV